MKNQAIVIPELIIAFIVLILALVSFLGFFSNSKYDINKEESKIFAINKATEILNSLLDEVPFAVLRRGNPGYIKVDDLNKDTNYSYYNNEWVKKYSLKFFNNNKKEDKGYICRGYIKDSSNITYLIHLCVEDILSNIEHSETEKIIIGKNYPNTVPKDFEEQLDVNFSLLKNPSTFYITNNEFFSKIPYQKEKPLTELDIPNKAIYDSPMNFFKDEGLENIETEPKFSFLNPTAERYTAKMIMKRIPNNTEIQTEWCLFKKLIIQIQWNIDPDYYSEPENIKGEIQRIHLMAIKGNLD